MVKIKDIPREERPREKAYLYGLSTLSNAELLALLLQTGSKEKSALELSYELLARYHGIYGVFHCSTDELMKVKGISKTKALKLKASFLLYERAMQDNLLSDSNFEIDRVALYFKHHLANEVQEAAYICVVDKSNHIIAIKELFKGTKGQIVLSPQIILKNVIENGSRFYLIHNHPSGNVYPSREDLETTAALDLMSLSLNIIFIDHLIIGQNYYYSINEKKQKKYLQTIKDKY
ncbi:MAG: DNA repair protein RadC [Bacillales bacterium]|nr:DNA repair protein RadC [Bacillales bacterium]